MHQTKSSRYLIVFLVWKICRTPVLPDVCFWINPVEKCTRYFPRVLRQQMKSNVMTYFGLAAPSVSEQVPHYGSLTTNVSVIVYVYKCLRKNVPVFQWVHGSGALGIVHLNVEVLWRSFRMRIQFVLLVWNWVCCTRINPAFGNALRLSANGNLL
jgi:hypothetical protein